MRHRFSAVLAALLLLALASLLFAGATGSVAVPLSELPAALRDLLHGQPSTMSGTLLELRLVRALSAFVTGASLALSGVMMQALLRNPLADPYILGVSGGAATGALTAMLFLLPLWTVDLSAFGGAVAVSLLLYVLARQDLRGGLAAEGGTSLLLLTGVILASGCMAMVTLMLSIAPESRLRGMVFWMIGDLSGTPMRWLPWVVLIAGSLFALRMARAINIVALHAEAAATYGVRVGALRQGLFFCSGLLTASAVTSGGSIGFVGLIVPHACRFALGPDHRLLLPAATLVGGSFLVLADTLARTIVAPQQLPVGVITAIIGVPVFLFQLHHLRRR
jgi:iron complex transport system permease protein